MVTVGLNARLTAKDGCEDALAEFLTGALPLAEQEDFTTVWFAVRADQKTFYIFDCFPTQDGRQQHLDGPIAKALMTKGMELLAKPPEIIPVDVLAAKIPN